MAKEYHLKKQLLSFDRTRIIVCMSTKVHMACEDILPPELHNLRDFAQCVVVDISNSGTYILIFHSQPQPPDSYNRTKDVDALIDPQLRL
jgi:hypothetical protein